MAQGSRQAPRHQSIHMCPQLKQPLFTKWHSRYCNLPDNGPQFTSSDFALFARNWSFDDRPGSPGHQQGNRQAESAVKTTKSILKKAKDGNSDPYLAILAARNKPTEYMDASPAQRLLGERTKTQLPTTAGFLKPQYVNTDDIKKKIKSRQQKQAYHYNREARDLPPLH